MVAANKATFIHRTGIIVVLFVLIAFIFAAYRFGWSGTGFLNKTLWDWLQLLIIPLALAVVVLVFQLVNTRTERQIAKERYEQDQQIALDKQHEDLLQAYLDRIAELLLKENLRTSPSEEVLNVARVRTITVLTQLNARRIGYIFTFLREAGLMPTTSNSSVMSLKDADLRAVKWRQANLSGANLSGADLTWATLDGANLSSTTLGGANLSAANLSAANLSKANLREADLIWANLSGANFWGANLSAANLSAADLSGAILREAELSKAILRGVKLNNAFLWEADLNGADLTGAYIDETGLNGANLGGAKVTEEQLKEAKSLKGATMPDGSIHP